MRFPSHVSNYLSHGYLNCDFVSMLFLWLPGVVQVTSSSISKYLHYPSWTVALFRSTIHCCPWSNKQIATTPLFYQLNACNVSVYFQWVSKLSNSSPLLINLLYSTFILRYIFLNLHNRSRKEATCDQWTCATMKDKMVFTISNWLDCTYLKTINVLCVQPAYVSCSAIMMI